MILTSTSAVYRQKTAKGLPSCKVNVKIIWGPLQSQRTGHHSGLWRSPKCCCLQLMCAWFALSLCTTMILIWKLRWECLWWNTLKRVAFRFLGLGQARSLWKVCSAISQGSWSKSEADGLPASFDAHHELHWRLFLVSHRGSYGILSNSADDHEPVGCHHHFWIFIATSGHQFATFIDHHLATWLPYCACRPHRWWPLSQSTVWAKSFKGHNTKTFNLELVKAFAHLSCKR